MRRADLDDHEGDQSHHGTGQHGDGQRRSPPVGGGDGEPVDQQEQATGDGDRPRDVVPGTGRALALVDDPGHREGGDQCDGNVDQQRPPPRGELGEGPAEDEPDGGAATGDAAVDPEGPGPLVGLGEGHGEQREGGGRHDGGEGTLQGTGTEEHGRVLGQAAEGGGGGEPEEADEEHPAPSQVVGDPAAEEEQAAEGQGIGAHHPLAIGHRDVQRPLGRGQGHDDHRGVEHDHQLGHRDHGKGPVPTRVGCGGQVLRWWSDHVDCHGCLLVSNPYVEPLCRTAGRSVVADLSRASPGHGEGNSL